MSGTVKGNVLTSSRSAPSAGGSVFDSITLTALQMQCIIGMVLFGLKYQLHPLLQVVRWLLLVVINIINLLLVVIL
mgnify:CR=1 FL=1